MKWVIPGLALLAGRPLFAAAQAHQPAGFTPLAENTAAALPPTQGFGSAVFGNWHVNPAPATQVGMVSSVATMCSPPGAWRATYTAGWTAGKGPITLLTQNWREVKRLYVKVCLKIGKTGQYENQPTGTKMMFFTVSDDPMVARCSIIPRVRGDGAVATKPNWMVDVEFNCAGVLPTANWTQLSGVGRPLRSDVWQVHEWLLDAGSVDKNDGSVQWWIDGQLVLNRTGVKIRTAKNGNTHGFSRWKWAPTWGGTAGVKTRADDYMIDHVYVSGL